ncbi:MAG: PKD domain-containing protein [Flavobacteriales bacterium]|nr:PKD domain-containing protein [Flavobacteriales bacterium]
MQDLTVYDCEGTLKDSESNALNPTWYSHDENFNFTICPPNALQITINFSVFSTEPINDYVTIYDGPDNTYPVLGIYSGTNLPPQVVSSGCITIGFISDQNIADEGFELSWITDVSIPAAPIISLTNIPTCSTTVFNILLDQLIHCDSVTTAQIFVGGQVNQTLIASPINCTNDSTNTIQLSINPGLNESGVYTISFQSFFLDDCGNIWDLSTSMQFVVNDCPLQVDLTANNTTICLGDCTDLYVNVDGGDSTSYNYVWNPPWNNSPGIQTVCPSTTTLYTVTVSDNGTSLPTSDTITINVVPPPQTQNNISICQNGNPINLLANPLGGSWSGIGIINSTNGTFNPNGLIPGIYTVDYGFSGCTDNMGITVLEIFAGNDISVCPNSSTFNLNSALTTPGGVWSGNGVQSNGDINVGGFNTIINAIYTLPNGCLDTLLVTVEGVSTQADDTLCQQSGIYPLTFSPSNGIWSVLPDNPQLPSSCPNAIINFPHQQGWESGFGGWTPDVNNDFDWIINNGGTTSSATGPQSSLEGLSYIYTEASNPNYPDKIASIISPCINLSAYNNPVLHFWYHKYGAGQGSFAVDVSTDNGSTWNWNIFWKGGDMGNQWNEAVIDLSQYNDTEVLIRLRVITGDWQSDVAVDKLAILAGPVTTDGNVLTSVASNGIYNLIYSIQGCDDYVDILIKEIDAGNDMTICPSQGIFNIVGTPNGGVWTGNHFTNTTLGTFDPSLGLGWDLITYSANGCTDTVYYNVVDTDVQHDTLIICSNSGTQILDMNMVPRTPWNGVWSGNGIISANYPGEFSPGTSGIGNHTITYTANSCSDDFIIKVPPPSIFTDTLICSSSSDIILNVNPPGGYWGGNGFVNNSIGLFSPSSLGIGSHLEGYMAPNGCADTFNITIYDNPVLSFDGFENYYCFKDTIININVSPIGGVLSGSGVNNYTFNPSDAGTGYHNITYTYGSGNCTQSIDTVIFVNNEFISTTYFTEDTICNGDLISIGVNVSGGTSNYTFSWNNGLSNSFQQLVSPTTSTNYIIISSDGCSDNNIDTIPIVVLPTFDLSFSTSTKQCFGETGNAVVIASPNGNYSYEWNTNPTTITDSINAAVNRNYMVEVKDENTGCIVSDTINIPGYDEIYASFFTNATSCLSLLNGEIQFLNASVINPNEIYSGSFWDFGDGSVIPFDPNINPTHIYKDTGNFEVTLVLYNNGLCSDTFSSSVCLISENKLLAPNSFTPNGDNCNDKFYLSGLGDFIEFNLKIYKRWGGDVVFESEEVMFTDNLMDEDICNDNNPYQEYYKMGSWDGTLKNGEKVLSGAYVFIATYYTPNEYKIQTLIGEIILIR